MKNSLIKRMSALTLSLAVVASCVHFTGLAEGTVSFVSSTEATQTMNNVASQQSVSKLYNYTGRYNTMADSYVKAEVKSNSDSAWIEVNHTCQYTSSVNAVTKLNGVDFTDGSVKLKSWSYNMTSFNNNYSYIGFLDSWNNMNATVTNNDDGTGTVTGGDAEFNIQRGNVSINSDNYFYVYGSGGQYAVDKLSIDKKQYVYADSSYTVNDKGSNIYGLLVADNALTGTDKKLYWKDVPQFKVSMTLDGDDYTYKVTALNCYYKKYNEDATEYTYEAHDDIDLITRTFKADSDKVLKYIILAGGNGSQSTDGGGAKPIKYTNITATYTKNVDYTAECTPVLNAGNGIVEQLNNNSLVINEDNAKDTLIDLKSVKTAYSALSDGAKSAFETAGYKNLEDKIDSAINQCNKAIYGTFTKQGINNEDISANKSDQQATIVYGFATNNNTIYKAGDDSFILNGCLDDGNKAYITTSMGNNGTSALSVLNKFNGVDLTDSNIKIKGYSYKMCANEANNIAYLGYLASISSIEADVANNKKGNATYTMVGANVAFGSNTEYCTLKGFINASSSDPKTTGKCTQYDIKFTTDETDDSYAVSCNSNIYAYKFFDDAKNSFLYWHGAPELEVSIKENNGGYLYTVMARGLYTESDDVYTAHDDVTVISKQLTEDEAKPYLKYVLLPAAKHSGGYFNRPILYKDINITYTAPVDCTDECVSAITTGDSVIDSLYSDNFTMTKDNAAQTKTNLETLSASVNALDDDLVSAIENKGYSDLKNTINKNITYADIYMKKSAPELLGIQLKKVTDISGADLRFVASYVPDEDTNYTIKGYGAIVIPNQCKQTTDAVLKKDMQTKADNEKYFTDVSCESDAVNVDGNNRFYITVSNSKGKSGLLFDCRPYVIYTDGENDYCVYAENNVESTQVTNGQASKCVLFGAKSMVNNILDKVTTPVYPATAEGSSTYYNQTSFAELLEKIGVTKTSSDEKTAILTFIYNNQ